MEARKFPKMPAVDAIEKRTWKLLHDYIGPVINDKRTFITKGFMTDGGSIPRLAWPIVGTPMQIPGIAAFILHDAEYAAKLYSRSECDKRLLIGLKEVGVTWFRRNAIYIAVRSGGWVPWKNYTDAAIEKAKKLCFGATL